MYNAFGQGNVLAFIRIKSSKGRLQAKMVHFLQIRLSLKVFMVMLK
jgi:hypothetical protein